MIFTPPTYILSVYPDAVELWQRGRKQAHLCGVLESSDIDFGIRFSALLKPARKRRLLVLLNMPDLQLEHEPKPKAGWLDRRKIIQRRLDYLFSHRKIRAVSSRGTTNILAGLYLSDWLKQIAHALNKSGCKVTGVHHIAFEAEHSLLPARHRQNGLLLTRLSRGSLLLALHDRMPYAARLIGPDDDMANVIEHSCRFMQRAGWSAQSPLTLTSLGQVAPDNDNWPQLRVHNYPYHDGYIDLLGQLFTRKASTPFSFRLLDERQRHRRWADYCRQGSFAALALSCLLWLSALLNLHQLEQHNGSLQQKLSQLPAPLAITDKNMLATLVTPVAIWADLRRLPTLPVGSFTLTLPTLQKPATASLLLQSKPLPIDHNLLEELPSWEAPASYVPRQGTLADDAQLRSYTYRLTYQPKAGQ